jgi:hypothetical protein
VENSAGLSLTPRDALVCDHLDFVIAIARAMRRRLPPVFELQDLVPAGQFGLIPAAERYDAANGPFIPFAQCWIRGAISDSVRSVWSDGSGRRAFRPLCMSLEDNRSLPCSPFADVERRLDMARAVLALPAPARRGRPKSDRQDRERRGVGASGGARSHRPARGDRK